MRKVPTYFHFLPFVVLYFFFNNILLPEGLLMTTLLTPVFVYWLYKKKQMTPLAKWSILLLLPLLFHMFIGFDFKSYFISTVLILSAWIFLFTALKASADIAEDMEGIFHKILVLNTFLIAMALLILPFPFLRDFFWYSKPISVGIEAFPRLKLFAYESSHYALLISPVVLFFLLKVIMGKSKHPLIYISLAMLPMVLSLSFGVLGALLMALLMGMVLFHKKLPKISALYASIAVMSMLLLLGFALWLWPDNPISTRLENIFSGKDTSANGRLFDSFMFANDMISTQSAWLGVGPGQVKILAHDMIIGVYKYTGGLAAVGRRR